MPIMKPPVMEHEATAERLAKEAVAFVEAGKPKSAAAAIDAAFDRAMRAAEAFIQDLQSRAEKAAIAAAQALHDAKEASKSTAYQSVKRGKFKPAETVKEEITRRRSAMPRRLISRTRRRAPLSRSPTTHCRRSCGRWAS